MSRLLVALVASAAVVAGAAWFVSTLQSERKQLAPVVAVAPQAYAPAREVAPLAQALELAAPAVESSPQVERAAARTTDEEQLARAQWVQGRVVFPPGTPPDEELFVTADGRDFADGSDHRVRVDRDGRFRVAFTEKSRTGRLKLEARYLYLEEPRSWSHNEKAGGIVLEPLLGGRIEARLSTPAGVSAAELGGTVKLSQAKRPSDVVILGEHRGLHSVSASGVVAFGGLEPELEYTLAYDGERCVGQSAKVAAVAGLTRPIDLMLEYGLALSGRVLDEAGTPLEGARIWAHPRFDGRALGAINFRDAESAADGTYRLGAFSLGKLQVNVQHEGFEPLELELEPPAGSETLERDLVLRRGHSISGTVRWPDGRPAEAWLRLSPWPESGDDRHVQSTDGRTAEDGTFTISGLSGGAFHVRASGVHVTQVLSVSAVTGRERTRKERETHTAEIESVAVGATGLELVLGPGLAVRGFVRDANGEPLDDFRVSARRVSFPGKPWDEEGMPTERFRDTGGAFELNGLQPGTWSVFASARNRVDSDAVEVQLPGADAIELVVAPEAVVRGTVLDAAGNPAPDLYVSASPADGDDDSDFRFGGQVPDETDRDGEFALDGLRSGRTLLRAADHAGVPRASLEVELVAGQTLAGVVLRMAPGGGLEVEIVDRHGRPQAGVTGWMHAPEGEFQSAFTTDVDGRFTGADLPAGKLRVQANDPEGLALTAEVEIEVGQMARVRLAPPATAPVRLTGCVLAGGAPVEGVRVSARLEGKDWSSTGTRVNAREETDAQGRYELTLPSSGRWLVSLHGYAYGSGSWTLPVDVPDVAALERDLAIAIASISGSVTDTRGEPLAGLTVRSEPQKHDGGPRGSARATTDAYGRYELAVPVGQHAVVVGGDFDGGGEASRSWTQARIDGLVLSEGERRTGIDFRLYAGGTLAGVVRGPGGAAVRHAVVYASDGSGLRPLGATDEHGAFRIAGLEPGTHWVRAIREQSATPTAVAVAIRAGEETQVELGLVPGRMELVRVVDAAGAPLGCEIEALDPDGRPVLMQSADVQGSVRIGPLTPGRYRISVRREDKHFEQTLDVSGTAIGSETILTFP
jgi:hypothetical protein